MSLREPSTSISSLSGGDAKTLLEIIHENLSCNTKEDFSRVISRIRALFPFDFAGAILGRIDDGIGFIMAYGINISFPQEWLNEYLSHRYFHLDAATQETFKTYTLNHWSYFKQKNIHVPREIKSLNRDFGVLESYCHGTAPSIPGNCGSMFCFASPSVKQEKRTEAILHLLTPHLHLTLSHIFNNTRPETRAVLSEREKEVINWLKRGKSSWDISVILGISERTVNYHVYNIMEKLNVTNRPQAVAVAIHLGLVDLD